MVLCMGNIHFDQELYVLFATAGCITFWAKLYLPTSDLLLLAYIQCLYLGYALLMRNSLTFVIVITEMYAKISICKLQIY
jgi:hypothetical protein